MILAASICGFCALLLFLVWKLALYASPRVYTLAEWEAAKLHVNIEAFRLLVDRQEELYLRRSLPPHCIRPVLRKRAAVAKEYVEEIDKNALMLLKMASIAQSSADPETARSAKEIMGLVLEVRLNAMVAMWYLRLKWFFPAWGLSLPTQLLAYDRLIDRGTCLLIPSHAMAPSAI